MSKGLETIQRELQNLRSRLESLERQHSSNEVQPELSDTDVQLVPSKEELLELHQALDRLVFGGQPSRPVVGLYMKLTELRDEMTLLPSGATRWDGDYTTTRSRVGSPRSFLDISPSTVVGIMAPFGNIQRIRIIQSLLFWSKSAKKLMEELSLTAGQLYHHLRELSRAGYLDEAQRNLYKLSAKGRRVAFIVFLGCVNPPKGTAPYED